MNLLFFIETGSGNGRALADMIIKLHTIEGLMVFSASSDLDQEIGVLKSVEDAGIKNLLMKGAASHQEFSNHVRAIRSFVKQYNIEIIHVQTNWELVMVRCALFGMKNRPKVLYTIHGFRNNKSWPKMITAKILITLQLLILADKVIATSNFLYNNFSLIQYKMSILPLGVDDRFINRDLSKVNERISIILPGMFREGKGQDMLIKAFSLYQKETNNKKSRLYLPGEGEKFEFCKLMVRESGLEDQIIFPGKLSKGEMLQYYDKCNVLVLTSKSETFSQVLAEAFCLGKCIISTPVGIAEDIIEEGENGYIIHNEIELKNVLIKLSKDVDRLDEMGRRNYTQRKKFSWGVIAHDYLDILSNL